MKRIELSCDHCKTPVMEATGKVLRSFVGYRLKGEDLEIEVINHLEAERHICWLCVKSLGELAKLTQTIGFIKPK